MFDPQWGDDPRDRGDVFATATNAIVETMTPRLGSAVDRVRGTKTQIPSRAIAMTHGGRSAAATLEVSTRATLFMRDLDLPRDREREVVDDARDRTYTLRGSETRALSTVGAFRVVRARDRRGRRGSARAKRFEISGEPK